MALTAPEPAPAVEPSEQGLPLPSLRIRGYRLFEDLTLPRLARVNLITGKNNTGKTALLEAIRIWADAGAPRTLREIIQRRGEDRGGYQARTDLVHSWSDLGIEGLFGGHPASLYEAGEILIDGVRGYVRALLITAGTYLPEHQAEVGKSWFAPNSSESRSSRRIRPLALSVESGDSPLEISWEIRSPGDFVNATSPDRPAPDGPNCEPCVFSSASGLGDQEKERLWDVVSLTADEDEVVQVVRLFGSQVERVNLRATGDGQPRSPYARITGVKHPIPLVRLGEGANRAFGLGLALVNARGGCLLLDEVENGIHYSVQADLWRMIFATAQRLNVQVFATTHSYDCIRGFQQAASENTEVEGMLIRLLEHEGKIVPTGFDERDLEIVTRRNLEVR